jgi:hypothetical protein
VSARYIFLVLTLAAAITHITSFVMIMAALDSRGIRTSILMAGFRFFKYLKTYREVTEKETGKPDALYRVCITAIVLALVFASAAVFIPWGQSR